MALAISAAAAAAAAVKRIKIEFELTDWLPFNYSAASVSQTKSNHFDSLCQQSVKIS